MNAEVSRIDQNPKGEALEKVQDEKENQRVQRDWRILKDHPKDKILGKLSIRYVLAHVFEIYVLILSFYLKLNLRLLKS